ncbi:hypothetical protein GOODEAATRI_022194, partial [Goodea atripinnis]
KPVLVLKPENVSVRMGESAHFYCQAKGDPTPTLVWSRERGPLPNGRYLINPDQTLQLHYVTEQDAGRYTCTAANHVGVVTATAQLLVEGMVSAEMPSLSQQHGVWLKPDSIIPIETVLLAVGDLLGHDNLNMRLG